MPCPADVDGLTRASSQHRVVLRLGHASSCGLAHNARHDKEVKRATGDCRWRDPLPFPRQRLTRGEGSRKRMCVEGHSFVISCRCCGDLDSAPWSSVTPAPVTIAVCFCNCERPTNFRSWAGCHRLLRLNQSGNTFSVARQSTSVLIFVRRRKVSLWDGSAKNPDVSTLGHFSLATRFYAFTVGQFAGGRLLLVVAPRNSPRLTGRRRFVH